MQQSTQMVSHFQHISNIFGYYDLLCLFYEKDFVEISKTNDLILQVSNNAHRGGQYGTAF